MRKILFVCTGGTCRSPMAEAILTQKLKEEKIKGYKVPSHNSLQLTKDLSENSLIITITKFHKEYISNLKNVLSLIDFYSGIDIPDPYGQDFDVYLKTARIIEFIVTEIVQNIKVGKI